MPSEAPLYRIRNWDALYENNISRKIKTLTWVATPNKHDGRGFRRLLKHPNGIALYGAWHLILQVASKMPKRGVLADVDGPLSAEDIADKTGAPVEVILQALHVCCQPDVGWMETSATSLSPDTSGDRPDMPGESPDVPGPDPGVPGPDPDIPGVKEYKGREQKGREGNRTERGVALASDTIAEEWIGVFLAAGVELSEAEVMMAYRGTARVKGFLSYSEEEQREILRYTIGKARTTSAQYMPAPINLLGREEWKRKGTGRLLPEPVRKSAADLAQERAAARFLAEG